VPDDCPRVLINRDKAGVLDDTAMFKKLEQLMTQDKYETEGANCNTCTGDWTKIWNFFYEKLRYDIVAIFGGADKGS